MSHSADKILVYSEYTDSNGHRHFTVVKYNNLTGTVERPIETINKENA